MPNWKKVITSGSNAELQSVNVSENVAITGSLYVSSSINTSTSELYSGSLVVLDWDLHQLKSNNIPSVEWDERKLYDASAEDSLDWHNRQLIGTDENIMLDWSGSALQASASIYMSASTQLYGTASYALSANTSSFVQVQNNYDPGGLYKLVFANASSASSLYVYPYSGLSVSTTNGHIYDANITGSLHGTASYSSQAVTSNTSLSSSITYQTDAGAYPLVYTTAPGNSPLHVSPYGAVYNTVNNSISNIGSVSASGGFFGTASYALTASHALTASNIYGAIKHPSMPEFLLTPGWSADYAMFSMGDGRLSIDNMYRRTNGGTRDYVMGGNIVVSNVSNIITGSFYSLFVGTDHVSTGSSGNNAVFGQGNYVSQSNYQTVVGRYNNNNVTQSGAFIIGSGDNSGNRQNLLVAYGDYFEVSASNIIAKGLVTSSTSNVLTYDTSTGQIYYTASSAIGGSGTTPTLQQVTDQGNDTTAYITASGFAMYDGAAVNYVTIQSTDGGIQVINNSNNSAVLFAQPDNITFGEPTKYVTFRNVNHTNDHEYQLPDQDGTMLVTPWTGSATFSGSFYLQGLTTGSTVDVLTFNPTTGQVYYTASNAIGSAAVIPTLQQVTDQGNTTTNNVIITGSLIVSGATGINTSTGQLSNGDIESIDWSNRWLSDGLGAPSVYWDERRLVGSNGETVIDWENATLSDANYSPSLTSVDWVTRTLSDTTQNVTVDWQNYKLIDTIGQTSIYWEGRTLNDFFGTASLDWYTRTLKDENNNTRLYWATPNQLILSASNLYVKGITTGSTSNVLTFNPATGQVYYTASAAIGGGAGSPTTPGGVNNNIQFNYNETFDGSNSFNFYKSTDTVVLTGSLVVSGSTYLQALTTTSVNNVLTYDPTTGQVYYTASSAIGNPIESDPIFTAWSGSSASQFAGTSSFALTASFVTASNVFGPFGSNSIQSASYALTASYVAGLVPGAPNNSIQFNNNNSFAGDSKLTFNPASASLSHGTAVTASGQSSFAQGWGTYALGNFSHAQGQATVAYASSSHTEGYRTATAIFGYLVDSVSAGLATLNSQYGNVTASFTDVTALVNSNFEKYSVESTAFDGVNTTVQLYDASVPTFGIIYAIDNLPGLNTTITINGQYAHAEGYYTFAIGDRSHTEGWASVAVGDESHAEGRNTLAISAISHAEGQETIAKGVGSHAEGYYTRTDSLYAHAEGQNTLAEGDYSHAEGGYTSASAAYSHAEGSFSKAIGPRSHAEGYQTTAFGTSSHAEGNQSYAGGVYAHAEGGYTSASAMYAHAEGYDTIAQAPKSHAEGETTLASGTGSHAEGYYTIASGDYAHSAGRWTTASGDYSYAGGIGSHAKGLYSYAGGAYTTASNYQTVVGLANLPTEGIGAFIIGNGNANGSSRANLFAAYPASDMVHVSGTLHATTDVYFPGLPVTSSSPFVVINPSNGRLHYVGKKEAIISGLGTGGVAIGSDAIAGGKNTTANGDQGFSIGDATIANGTNAVSTGKDTIAVGSGSLTTGDTTTAVGDNSVATGKDTIANGTSSLATGTTTKADGDNSVATGRDTIAAGTSSLATGKSTIASGSNSVATGRDTVASGSNSLTAGSGSKAEGENSVAFGKGTIAKTDEQVVIGKYNTEDTQSLFVVGAGTNDANRKTIMKVDTVGARIDGSMTISGSSTFTNIGPAVFSGSIVQGSGNASGDYSVALGYQTQASGEYSMVMGRLSQATANYSTAMGYDTLASGFSSLATGVNSQALGYSSIVGGTNTTASGSAAAAFGSYTYAAGNSSFAAGAYSRANGLYSSVFGLRVTASGDHQFAVGRFNLDIDDAAAFIIGNGNVYNRSNLLVAGGDVVQITGSLNINGNAVANSFTGSLLGNVIGTSSWASNAITSSFANTASFVNTLNQNVTISGSLNVSGSILPSNRKLYYSDGTVSVDWEASETYDSHGNNKSIEWDNRILRDANGVSASIDWGGRRLHDSNGTRRLIWNTSGVQVSGSLNVTGSVIAPTFTGSLRGHVVTSSIDTSLSLLFNGSGQAANWGNSTLIHSNITSVDWASRVLVNSSANTTVNWQNGILSDNSGNTSVHWIDRSLKDSNATMSVNYHGRVLHDGAGTDILEFSKPNKLTGIGAISTVLTSNFFSETEDTQSINYYAGELYDNLYAVPGDAYGELLYLDYSTAEWTRIDQTTDVCTRYIGIDLKGKDGVLTEGYIVMTDAADPFAGGIPQIENPLLGMPVYIREGATGLFDNSYTCTIPTSGYVRVIGHVIYQSPISGYNTKYMIKLKPSNDWYEI